MNELINLIPRSLSAAAEPNALMSMGSQDSLSVVIDLGCRELGRSVPIDKSSLLYLGGN